MADDQNTDLPRLPPHPFTDNGPSNTQIGADGNSMLPGDAARERKRRGNDRRFKGFPKHRGLNHQAYDVPKIKREYMESPIVDWAAYCASRGYNPQIYGFAWKQWVREKKYKSAWGGLTKELEDEASNIGPRSLLSAIRAAKSIPETAAGMLALIQHTIKIHFDEMRADQLYLEQQRAKGLPPDMRQMAFSVGSQDAVFLASSLKQTSEVLMKSLGIDSSVGLDPERWMRMVEQELGKIDGTQELSAQEDLMSVEVVGATDLQATLKEAVTNYLDKPIPPTPTEPVPEPFEENSEEG